MRQLVLGMALIILMYPHAIFTAVEVAPRPQLDTSAASIEYPVEGQWLQGDVVIKGSLGSGEIKSYEIEFAYATNPSDTWFLIQDDMNPVDNDVLATWKTAEIADGEYFLRLLVNMADGTTQGVMINGLRVSNDAPIEVAGPSPMMVTSDFTPIPVYITSLKTPTALPANPVEISDSQVFETLGKGGLVSLVSFALLGIYLGVRRRTNKRK